MNRARAELIVKGLNRKYPQDVEWQISIRNDGAIRFAAGWLVRIMPTNIFFNSHSVNDIWHYIEKHYDLDDSDLLERERKRLLE